MSHPDNTHQDFTLLLSKIDDLTRRLEAVERRMREEEPHTPLPQPQETSAKVFSAASGELAQSTLSPQESAAKSAFMRLREEEIRRATERSDSMGEFKSSRIFGGIAILCFILASVFFVKLAIDAGWLTPIRQLVSLVIFGCALIVSGFHLKNVDSRYASFLPAAGVVVLYITAFSGHLYFGIYDNSFGTVLAGAVSFLALYLFRHFSHDIYIGAAIVGSYFIPLLLGNFHGNLYGLALYYFFWDIVFCALALIHQQRTIILLAAYVALLSFYAACGITDDVKDSALQIAFMQALQCAILAISTSIFSIRLGRTLSAREAWQLLPIGLIFYGLEYTLISSVNSSVAPWAAVGFAAFIYGLYHIVRSARGTALASAPMVATYLAIIFLHAVYFESTPQNLGAWLAFGVAALLVYLVKVKKLPYESFWPFLLALGVIPANEYMRVLAGSTADGAYTSPELILYGLIFSGGLCALYHSVRTLESAAVATLAAAHIQLLMLLNRLAALVATDDTAQFLTSGLWAAWALGLLCFAYQFRDALLVKASIAVFAIVSGKLLMSDLAAASGPARVVALVVIGIFIYAGGLLLRRVNRWKANE